MAAGEETEVDVLIAVRAKKPHRRAAYPPEVRNDLGVAGVREVDRSRPHALEHLGRWRRQARIPAEADDQSVEIRLVRAPVLRVADQCELLPTIQPPTRKGPEPIGVPVFGFSMPSVQIRARSSPASACCGRTNQKRRTPPREARPQDDPDRLRIHRADAADEACDVDRQEGRTCGSPGA